MTLNIFNMEEVFSNALEKPNIVIAIVIAVVAGLVAGFGGYYITGNELYIVSQIIANLIQILILTIILTFLGISFAKKNKRFNEGTFSGVLSIAGNIWILVIIANLISLIDLFLLGSLTTSILFVILAIISVLIFYELYVAIKVITGIKGKSTLIPWILTIILFTLLYSFIYYLLIFI
jgi:hypothetical protein